MIAGFDGAGALLVFVVVAALQVGSPGPSTLLIVNNALLYGSRAAIWILTGDLAAIALLGVLSALGVGLIVDENPYAFVGLRIVGGAYLGWLGWRYLAVALDAARIRSAFGVASADASRRDLARRWRQAFVTGATNPKALVFFSAFFPQFVDRNVDVAPQYALLIGLFVAVKLAILGGYAVLSGRLGSFLASPKAAKAIDGATGAVFLSFGALMIASVFLR